MVCGLSASAVQMCVKALSFFTVLSGLAASGETFVLIFGAVSQRFDLNTVNPILAGIGLLRVQALRLKVRFTCDFF